MWVVVFILLVANVGFGESEQSLFNNLKTKGIYVEIEKGKYDVFISEKSNINTNDLIFMKNLSPSQVDSFATENRTISNNIIRTLKEYTNIRILTLKIGNITDDDIAILGKLEKIEVLSLGFNKISGTCLVKISEFRNLEELSLNNNPLIEDNLKYIVNLPKLRILHLSYTPLTDKAVDILGKIKNKGIAAIIAYGTKITKKGGARLKKMLPNCEIQLEPPKEAGGFN